MLFAGVLAQSYIQGESAFWKNVSWRIHLDDLIQFSEGGGGKFGGALGEIMAVPLPLVLMGDIVAAEFLGDT